MIPLLLAGVGAVGVGLIYFGLVVGRRGATDTEFDAPDPYPPRAKTTVRDSLGGPLQDLAAPFMRGRDSQLQLELMRADLNLKAYEFVLLQVASALILGAIGYIRFGNPLVGLGAAVGGYFLPGFYLKRRQRKRKRAFDAVLGDTIVLMSNGIKAGYSIQQAMNAVADSGRPPMAEEIGRVVRETSLGIDLETALEHLNTRLASKDFDLLVTAVMIHRAVGGNLAEVLDKIATTIRERVRVQGEVSVLTAQARASGYIITALPFAVAGILSLISPGFEKPLFTNPIGWVLITIGLISIGIGYAIIRRITDIHL